MPKNSVVEAKAAMRKEVIARRDALDPEVRGTKSQKICDGLWEYVSYLLDERLDREAQGLVGPLTVALFSALGSEVDLTNLAERLYRMSCRVCYPAMVKTAPDHRPVMAFYEVERRLALEDKPLFMKKPAHAFTVEEVLAPGIDPVAVRDIDLVVAPLVAFDDEGWRLGYGGGNYDALFMQMRADSHVVGVAFSEQRVEHVPHESHDLPLEMMLYK